MDIAELDVIRNPVHPHPRQKDVDALHLEALMDNKVRDTDPKPSPFPHTKATDVGTIVGAKGVSGECSDEQVRSIIETMRGPLMQQLVNTFLEEKKRHDPESVGHYAQVLNEWLSSLSQEKAQDKE